MHLSPSPYCLAVAPPVLDRGGTMVMLTPLWQDEGGHLVHIKDSGLARLSAGLTAYYDDEVVDSITFSLWSDSDYEDLSLLVLRPDKIFETRTVRYFRRLYP